MKNFNANKFLLQYEGCLIDDIPLNKLTPRQRRRVVKRINQLKKDR